MVKHDDTSATEKLLEMIREEQTGENYSSSSKVDSPAEAATDPPLSMEKDSAAAQEEEEIRDTAPAPSKAIQTKIKLQERTATPQSSISSPLTFLATGKKDGLGIDIRTDGIGLVRMVTSGSRLVPQNSQFVSFDLETPLRETGLISTLIEADWFAPFLRNSLTAFCGNDKKAKIWCALPREAVESHNVIIPKVPDKDLYTTVFWSAQKKVTFDRNAILLDFEPVKEISSEAGSKLLCLIFLATQREVEGLKKLFIHIGFPLTGISSPATALVNEIHKGNLQVKEESFSHLSLGEEKSFIELYYRNQLVFTRDIKTGVASLVDSIIETAGAREMTLDEKTCRQWLLGTPKEQSAGGSHQFFSKTTEVFSKELPAALRLVRQMERTFDYCKNNFNVPRSSMVYLSGLTENGTRLARYVRTETGIESALHLPQASSSFASAKLVTAYGMALSNERKSQNFLHTYEDKIREKNIFRVNKIIAAACVALLLCCSGLYFLQMQQIRAKEKILAKINTEIKKYSRNIAVTSNPNQLNARLQLLKKASADNIMLATRYFPVALIQELTGNLPAQVKLLHLDLLPDNTDSEKKNTGISSVIMEGIVMGQKEQREFLLAKYLRKLSDSSFVSAAHVTERGKFSYEDDEVLGFTISVTTDSDTLNPPGKEK